MSLATILAAVSVEPSNVKLALSTNAPAVLAYVILPLVKSDTFALPATKSVPSNVRLLLNCISPSASTYATALSTWSVNLSSDAVATTTLPVPFGSRIISPLESSLIILLPLRARLLPGPAPDTVYSSEKLSLILSKAVRSGSPDPSFAAAPMLIDCCAIKWVSVIVSYIYTWLTKPLAK